jgi:alcohol dehydrogenase YqhD (iron-dependent ADH family)
MENFDFLCPTKVIFGRNAENNVGKEVVKYGKKALLHYGGGSIKKTGLYERVAGSLREEGVEIVELGGVRPNPKLSLIRQGIKVCRENGVDFVLAVGGGSVIDSAKAIGVGVPYAGDVWDFYAGKGKPLEALPVGIVMTIAGSGTEACNGSVVKNEEAGLKRNLNNDVSYPKFVIMNPELTFTVGPYQTACGAADIMSHVLERYFTLVKNVEFTDRLCEATLKTVISSAPIAIAQPDNYAARADLLWTGTVAHNNFLGTGRISDWASHKIEHEVTALNDGTHGAGMAVLFPAWMRFVYRLKIEKFAQFAVRVMNVEEEFDDPEKTALAGIRRLQEFFKSLGLPTTLGEIKITENDFPVIASKCQLFDETTVGHFARLTREDIVKLLQLAK